MVPTKAPRASVMRMIPLPCLSMWSIASRKVVVARQAQSGHVPSLIGVVAFSILVTTAMHGVPSRGQYAFLVDGSPEPACNQTAQESRPQLIDPSAWHALRYSEGRGSSPARPSEDLRACHPVGYSRRTAPAGASQTRWRSRQSPPSFFHRWGERYLSHSSMKWSGFIPK